MPTALSSLSFTLSANASWQAAVNETGFSNGVQNNNTASLKINLGSASANATAGGSDELYVSVLSIAASSTTTFDLCNLTDACNQANLSFARLKYWRFSLLSISDPSGIGTACTSVTVGAAAAAPFLFNLGGTTPTVSINNGAIWECGDPGATGYVVNPAYSHNVKVVNNDSGTIAKVLVVLVGGST